MSRHSELVWVTCGRSLAILRSVDSVGGSNLATRPTGTPGPPPDVAWDDISPPTSASSPDLRSPARTGLPLLSILAFSQDHSRLDSSPEYTCTPISRILRPGLRQGLARELVTGLNLSMATRLEQVAHPYPSSLRCWLRRAAAVSRWVSSWRRVVPYLLARLLYQVRVVRSMVVLWSATSFWIRLRSTPMAWVGASAGGMASRVWRAVASSEASMALRFFLALVRADFSFLISVGVGALSGWSSSSLGAWAVLICGVEAGVFSSEDGSFGELRSGEEFDDGLVGEVGGFLVVFAGFGGGEPGVDHRFPASVGGGL